MHFSPLIVSSLSFLEFAISQKVPFAVMFCVTFKWAMIRGNIMVLFRWKAAIDEGSHLQPKQYSLVQSLCYWEARSHVDLETDGGRVCKSVPREIGTDLVHSDWLMWRPTARKLMYRQWGDFVCRYESGWGLAFRLPVLSAFQILRMSCMLVTRSCTGC